MLFKLGQRWISETENNLGLGIIVECNYRTVTILFPIADEQRIYAVDSAPLVRILFNVGDIIQHHTGWQGKVLSVEYSEDLAVYQVENLADHDICLIKEIDLAHQIRFGKPQDRLFSAQIDRNDHFVLRYQSLLHQQAQYQSPLRGLRGIRASLMAHQLHIAKEVGQRIYPRVLLADEVGLGKTIEAGMILQQQLFQSKVTRALIIVPENLQHQWLVEMLRRFNLNFALFDEERCADFDRPEYDEKVNPFASENLIICALDWLIQYPQRVEQLKQAEFDMLIVDEAHHLAWSEQEVSPEYQLIEQLTQQIPAVLLLTATPEQLGLASHFARLRLLDPNRFYDFQAFCTEQAQYQPVSQAVESLLSGQKLTDEQKQHIASLLTEQDCSALFTQLEQQNEQHQQTRQRLIDDLIDRHGTSRVLFRNSRQSVQGFPQRIYHPINFPQPKQYENAIKVMGLLQPNQQDNLFYPEQIFQQLNPEAAWWAFDPRIDWLTDFVKNHRENKILVICQQANTAIQLEQALRQKEGIRCAVFHENMSIIERDRASAYFAQQEEGAQVLLSSHIGSEGRNFQFAHHLILFNLPTHPDRLEQCIGRLDRIGQQQDIHIYTLCFAETAQQHLAQWYHQGLNAFEQTCPTGSTLFAKCGEKLQYFLQNEQAHQPQAFQQFLQSTQQQRQELQQQLEQGRDRLLEIHSYGGIKGQQLAEQIAQQEHNQELAEFANTLFDIIGLEQEDLDENSFTLSTTGNMLIPDFPGIKTETTGLTLQRSLALAREDLEFLTWDHPIICHGIDLLTSGDIGKASTALLINKNIPTGTLLLELIFIVEVQAPKALQLERFLPPTPIRLLVDKNGNNLAEKVSFTQLNKQLKPLKKQLAHKIIKTIRADIEQGLDKAKQLIQPYAKQLIQQAKQQSEQVLSQELDRLVALQRVNKNIRTEEIEKLQQIRLQSSQALNQADWRLDSLRVIISNKE
ncbi:RNA polymerase-associated protein RapA [Volucribacter amazonae]|uniref:RNA polymerase-associated protein RapA n=1 Tax=Volucribacter amazonae TaxID=256731 RepID=A0A9X4PEL9_9PAST|nr:RNA polymerase-associated protein RapA [Volucribacter amazonae]MDG6895849.1 RNA polymerase-binding ATPase [Volucribacter amazonae]